MISARNVIPLHSMAAGPDGSLWVIPIERRSLIKMSSEGEVLLTVPLPEDASLLRVDARGQVLVGPGYIIRE
jgi:hypothetical protein